MSEETSAISNLSMLRKATLALITVALLFGALELTLRISGLDFFETNQIFPLNRDMSFTDIYDKDSQLFWKLKSSTTTESTNFSNLNYRINDSGFRGPEWDKLSGSRDILCMGNSCTFGWAVEYDAIYTEILNKSYSDYRALNCGTPGYSSYQGKTLLNQLLQTHKPEIITLMFGWNDHWPAGSDIADKNQTTPPQWTLALQNTLSNFKIYQAMRKLALSASSSDQSPTEGFSRVTGKRRVGLTDFADNLKEMVKASRGANAQPIILVPPVATLTIYLPNMANSPFHDLHAEYQATARRVAAEMNCPLLDLQPLFDEHSNLFDYPVEDPVHFNAAGHQEIGSALSALIDSLITR